MCPAISARPRNESTGLPNAYLSSGNSCHFNLRHHARRLQVRPNPSLKRSANGRSRQPSSAGPSAHFALAGQRARRFRPLSSNVRPREEHELLAGFSVAAMGRTGTRFGCVVPVRFVHRCHFPPPRLEPFSEGTRPGTHLSGGAMGLVRGPFNLSRVIPTNSCAQPPRTQA